MQNVKLVIFDMDGLMLDTESLQLTTSLAVAADNNVKITREVLLQTIGVTVDDEEEILRNALGDHSLLKRFKESISQRVSDRIEQEGIAVKEGLFELLDFLEENDISKVVATSNYRERVDWLLEKAGVRKRFCTMVCGDEVENGKPSPDLFLKACEIMNADKSEALVLEDSINGLKAAKAAGIRCILIPDLIEPTPEEEKMAYRKLNDLKEVIGVLEVNFQIYQDKGSRDLYLDAWQS